MISELARGACQVAQKFEPIAIGMPAIAVLRGAWLINESMSSGLEPKTRMKRLGFAAIYLLSGSSILYSRKVGLTASTICLLASAFINPMKLLK